MSSRDKILSAIRTNQPESVALPEIANLATQQADLVKKFSETLEFIGGKAIAVSDYDQVIDYIIKNYTTNQRIISSLVELSELAPPLPPGTSPHDLENVSLTVLKSEIGVAENGAIWLTENHLAERALPFITEYLAIVLQKKNIVGSMHDAYNLIGTNHYGFGVFIAGPSKTSDIEQSLVLGAHGPKEMTIFLMD